MSNKTNSFEFSAFQVGKRLTIPSLGGCSSTIHSFEERDAWAVMAAMYAGRPLLLRGEPGTGKTQLAQAAAHILKRNLLTTVVQSRTEWQDLLWQIDPVERLSMAHVIKNTQESNAEDLAPKNFLTPGPLWYALNWESAEKKRCRFPAWVPPPPPKDWKKEDGVVMLIDEIDKAEPELANALLEVFGQGAFRVPALDEIISSTEGAKAPLVIITTNEERELPKAFLRRCLVLQLGLPKKQQALINYLSDRGQMHFPKLDTRSSKQIYISAAEQLLRDREAAEEAGQVKPGQAEYLDLLRVLNTLKEEGQDPQLWLNRVLPYTYQKGPEAKQQD